MNNDDNNNSSTTGTTGTSRRRMLRNLAGATGAFVLATATGAAQNTLAAVGVSNGNGNANGNNKKGQGPLFGKLEPKASGPHPNSDGSAMTIGQINSPSNNVPISPTTLQNPSVSALAVSLLKVQNYTNRSLENVLNGFASIIGYTSGDDSSGGVSNSLRFGIYGLAESGSGIRGEAVGLAGGGGGPSVSCYGGSFKGETAALYLEPHSSEVGPPPSIYISPGAMQPDVDGNLYFCVSNDGGRVTWRKLAGPTTAGTLHLLAFTDRFVSTRNGQGGVGTPLMAGNDYHFQIAGTTGRDGQTIPFGATAIVGSVGALDPATGGYIKLLPDGTDNTKGTGSITFTNVNTVTSFSCALSAAGKIQASVFQSTHVNLVIDVVGYYL